MHVVYSWVRSRLIVPVGYDSPKAVDPYPPQNKHFIRGPHLSRKYAPFHHCHYLNLFTGNCYSKLKFMFNLCSMKPLNFYLPYTGHFDCNSDLFNQCTSEHCCLYAVIVFFGYWMPFIFNYCGCDYWPLMIDLVSVMTFRNDS